MSLNGYLTKLSDKALIRDAEKDSIQTSIATLKTRLCEYFDGLIEPPFIFGSYSRQTILPRYMDANSDVDYMVVFKNLSLSPQTYLNQLRSFVENRYSTSEVSQSRPTIVLTLGHIKFDLVPAIRSSFAGPFKIPAKASEYIDWISTNPKDFNDEIIKANESNESLIKPLVRLMKYWNAKNNYVFESFDLEKQIVRHNFKFASFFRYQLKDYLVEFIESMNPLLATSNRGFDAIKRAQKIIAEVKSIERRLAQSPISSLLETAQGQSSAEAEIKKLLPEPSLSAQLAASLR